MPRLESKKRNQFWEIATVGNNTMVRYGSLGTDGKMVPHCFATPEEAKADADRRVHDKLKVGYDLIGASPDAARCPINPKLEAALLDSFDDEVALIYADWLQAQGDPRGELIMVQNQLAQDPKLSARERALFRAHWPHFWPRRFGELVRRPRGKNKQHRDYCAASWRNGFIETAYIGHNIHPRYTLRELINELFEHPSARFLRALTIGATCIQDEQTYQEAISALILARPRSLLELTLFDTERPLARLDDLANLYESMPRLSALTLSVREVKLGAISLPRLERFSLRCQQHEPDNVRAIAKADWPKLSSLSIDLGLKSLPADARDALFSASMPQLCELTLERSKDTIKLCQQVASSGLLEGLEVFGVPKGTLVDADVDWLISRAEDFEHLSWLDLSHNHLSKIALSRLGEAGLRVLSDGQYPNAPVKK